MQKVGTQPIDVYVKNKGSGGASGALPSEEEKLCQEVVVEPERHLCATYECNCDSKSLLPKTDPGLFPCVDEEVRNRLHSLPYVKKELGKDGNVSFKGGAGQGNPGTH